MSPAKELIIIDLVKDLPEDKINSVIDFIRFIKVQPIELDDYDYELTREAEKISKKNEKNIPLDKILEELELSLSDIQD